MELRAGQRLPLLHHATLLRSPNSQEVGGEVEAVRESLGAEE